MNLLTRDELSIGDVSAFMEFYVVTDPEGTPGEGRVPWGVLEENLVSNIVSGGSEGQVLAQDSGGGTKWIDPASGASDALTSGDFSDFSAVAKITENDVNNWDTAHGWGDHASAGYVSGGDVSGYASAGDLSGLASTGDLSGLASTGDLSGLASTGDLSGLASMGDLSGLASTGDLSGLASDGDVSGLLSAVVDDPAPQLGSDLDLNGNSLKLSATAPPSDHTILGGLKFRGEAGSAFAPMEKVYLLSGVFRRADADFSTAGLAIATALESMVSGASGWFHTTWSIARDDSESWNVDAGPLWVSTTTGKLTQTRPSGSGDQAIVAGFPLGSTSWIECLGYAYVENK